MAHRFTIGVEEEFQIIDPATCELRSHVSQIVSAASPDIADQVKPELHQSIVETGTRICENVSDLRIEMHRTRGELVAAAERVGLRLPLPALTPFLVGSTRSSRPVNATKTSSRSCNSSRARF